MGAARFCLILPLPVVPLFWAKLCFTCTGNIPAWLSCSSYHKLICVRKDIWAWAKSLVCPVRSHLFFWGIFCWKNILKQNLRPTMRFQTIPTWGLGLQQSRQHLSHFLRVAGKHRALKPEQAASSQQQRVSFFVLLLKEIFQNKETYPGLTNHLTSAPFVSSSVICLLS